MYTSSPFVRKAAIASLVAFMLLALGLLLGYAANFILLVFGGILTGVLLATIAGLLHRKVGLTYGLSLATVVLLIGALCTATVWLLAPTVSQQTEQLAQAMPQAINRLEATLSQTSWGKKILEGVPKSPASFVSGQKDILGQLTGIFSSTLGILANVVIVLITGIYLASDPGQYKKGFARLFTPSFRGRLEEVLDQCYHTLSNWLLGRFIAMVMVGVATGLGLYLLDIPLPITLAIIAGLLNFIPNIGPYLSLVPALLMAYLQGPDKALYVVGLYIGIQSLEGYVLTPLLNQRLVSTPPAVLLFAQVLLGILVGMSGVLLASPLVAVLVVLINELYIRDFLERPNQDIQHVSFNR